MLKKSDDGEFEPSGIKVDYKTIIMSALWY